MTTNFNLRLIPLLPFIGATLLMLFGRKWKKDTVTVAPLTGAWESSCTVTVTTARQPLFLWDLVLASRSPTCIFPPGPPPLLTVTPIWLASVVLLSLSVARASMVRLPSVIPVVSQVSS